MENQKVKFYHPSGKGGKFMTSKGEIVLESDGTAMVSQEMYDHLMRIPKNKEYQDKLKELANEDKKGKQTTESKKQDSPTQPPALDPTVVPTLEEYVKAGYKADTYEKRFFGLKAGDTYDGEKVKENLEQAEKENKTNSPDLKEEDLKILGIKELKAMAGKREIKFDKDATKDELIKFILDSQAKNSQQ